jgi:hypothetical protein
MRSPLLKRVEKLEAAWMGAEVKLEEVVWWSYHLDLCRPDNPKYVAYARRCETSRLCRLILASIKPAAGQAEAIRRAN